jgi:hypothetical protein
VNLQKVLRNSVAVGILVIILNPGLCENNSNRNVSCRGKEIISQESDKIFVDKDGQVWHFYSNYSDDKDSSSDADQYGVFY